MDESLDNGKLLYSGARSAEQTRNAVSNDGLSSAVKRRSIPDSLLPQSVEGIGYMLADAALRLTRSPAVVVVRDPAMQTASVVAASTGTDRRLLGVTVAPTSVAGRACIADVTAYATGGQELLGRIQANRRRHEEQGVAFSLRDGRRSVGALVVFGPPELIDRSMDQRLVSLAAEAGREIGRTLAERIAKRQGLIDEITGQPNRRGLEKIMRDFVRRQGSLVRVDIDQLLLLGSGVVNSAIRQVATILRSSLRDYDVLARIEGGEFALFLPDTPSGGAIKVADRIRIAVNAADVGLGGERVLKCSLGVASITDTVSAVDDLLEAAASALKEARDSGPNLVVAYRERTA